MHVVRTEFNIPHLRSHRNDMALVHGYLVASDRYWMMELGRRLGQGRVSEIFGSAALLRILLRAHRAFPSLVDVYATTSRRAAR